MISWPALPLVRRRGGAASRQQVRRQLASGGGRGRQGAPSIPATESLLRSTAAAADQHLRDAAERSLHLLFSLLSTPKLSLFFLPFSLPTSRRLLQLLSAHSVPTAAAHSIPTFPASQSEKRLGEFMATLCCSPVINLPNCRMLRAHLSRKYNSKHLRRDPSAQAHTPMRAWVDVVREREGRRRGKEGEREGRVRAEGEGGRRSHYNMRFE